MIVEDKNIERACSFYVSDFHLEMMLMPYINEKIENRENIIIKTEKDLNETINTVVSKMNLKEENKEKILNLGWKQENDLEIEEKSNVIVIGTQQYIQDINTKIEESKIGKVNIIDCYNFEDVKDNISNIIESHDKSLNTLGFNKF